MANFVYIGNYHINTDAIKYYTTSRSDSYTDKGAIVSYNISIYFIDGDSINISGNKDTIKSWVSLLDCIESAETI